MEKLIESIESALNDKNWYAALTLTLTLPDIAGKIDEPESPSGARFAKWFNNYVGDKYKGEVGAEHKKVTYLNGEECYSLRCSYLHEGKTDISGQKVHDILDDFVFVAPIAGILKHRNLYIIKKDDKVISSKLQLQVDFFCRDITAGVRQWLKDISKDTEKQKALSTLINILEIK